MNKAFISKLVLCFGVIVLFANCGGSFEQSSTTGWNLDDPEWEDLNLQKLLSK